MKSKLGLVETCYTLPCSYSVYVDCQTVFVSVVTDFHFYILNCDFQCHDVPFLDFVHVSKLTPVLLRMLLRAEPR